MENLQHKVLLLSKKVLIYQEFQLLLLHIISQVPLSKENMIVGFVNEVRGYLVQLGISTPDIDYPEELTKYLGRKIKKEQ